MWDVADLGLVGGDVALDFVNTVEDRASASPDDTLRTPDDLRRWGERVGILRGAPASAGAGADGELRSALALREDLHAILVACAERVEPPAPAVHRLASAAAEALRAGTLAIGEQGRLEWRWPPSALASVRHTIAARAVDLLREPGLERVRRCEGDGCGWLFVDATKNSSRRWCSMRGCGMRAKNARRNRG